MTLTVGSLFSGAGLGDLGLQRAGWEHRWFVEVDPWRRKVLHKRWPGVPIYEDIQEVNGRELEWVDLIAGGFPCQDISTAGVGRGIWGPKSRLWFDMLRVCSVVRPMYILVENSPELINRGLSDVLSGLAKAGYVAEWSVISAGEIGAPHERKRIWIVAHTDGQHGHTGQGD